MKPCSHLLIDGYNVLHDFEDWKDLLSKNSGSARDCLVQRAQVIHDVDGILVTVVFDGIGAQRTVEHPCEEETFTVVYAPKGESADAIIEQMVLRSKVPESLVAVTKDHMIGESLRVRGARVISPKDFADWVAACESRQAQQAKKLSQDVDKQFGYKLGDS